MNPLMADSSARDLMHKIIEDILSEDPDARFHQHKHCFTCEKAVSQSRILKMDHKDLPKPFSSGPKNVLMAGCHLCSLLFPGISDAIAFASSNQNPDPVAIPTRIRQLEDSQGRLVLRVSYAARNDNGRISLSDGRIGLGKHNPNGTEIEYGPSKGFDKITGETWTARSQADYELYRTAPDTLFSLSTSSLTTFGWIKELLKNCQSFHKSCRKSFISATQVPARLLDVSAFEANGTVRLVEAFSRIPRPKYLALSHRWGKSPTTKLVKSTKSAFEKSVPVCSLPLTFQHAIMATVRIGLPYLWIDSLCIVQDSPMDWEQESAVMGDIYRGSICTIAASRSEKGLFSSRNPLEALPCRLNREFGIDSSRLLPSDPLESRGWIVQERALSPRTVFYRERTVGWECVETQVDEQGVTERRDQSKSRFYNLSLIELGKVDLSALHSLKSSDSVFMFHTYWRKLLQVYTVTELTKPSDKLVAINGIVSKIQKSARLSFIAGLWKELLPAELLWTFVYPGDLPLASSGHEYRAPTWSWACLDGPVTSQWVQLVRKTHEWKWMVNVLEAKAKSLPNGQVLAARLRLSGPLQCFRKADGQQGRNVSNAELWTPDDGVNAANEDLWAVLVARTGTSDLKESASGIELSKKDIGLVLTPSDEKKTTFRRRGYFEEDYWASDNRHFFRGNVAGDVKTFDFI